MIRFVGGEAQRISIAMPMVRGMSAGSASAPRGPQQIGTQFFVVFVVALFAAGALFAYELSLFLGPPLFIPAGTVVDRSGATIDFTVAGGPGRLIGRWHATRGGWLWLNPPSNWASQLLCIDHRDWNGTANVSLWPGRYTLLVSPGPQGQVIVTETIRVAYPGDRNATDHAFFASWCGG